MKDLFLKKKQKDNLYQTLILTRATKTNEIVHKKSKYAYISSSTLELHTSDFIIITNKNKNGGRHHIAVFNSICSHSFYLSPLASTK